MSTIAKEFLTSDELRLLTNRGTSFLQLIELEKLKIKFDIDQYGCPLVRYQDVKHLFLLQGKLLPRGLPSTNEQ
jgi:hypothetical protein